MSSVGTRVQSERYIGYPYIDVCIEAPLHIGAALYKGYPYTLDGMMRMMGMVAMMVVKMEPPHPPHPHTHTLVSWLFSRRGFHLEFPLVARRLALVARPLPFVTRGGFP